MKPQFILPFILLMLFSCSKKAVDNGPVTYHIVDKIETPPQKEPKKGEKAATESAEPFFKVKGIDSSWSLEMSEKQIRYISDNKEESFSVPYATAVKGEGDSKIYRSKSKANDLEVTVYDGKCSDDVTETVYLHLVKVAIKKTADKDFKILKGCGNYVLDSRLNVPWTLQQIKGKTVVPGDFGKELPYMDLHINIGQFTGFAGCNRLKGKLDITEGNHIKFNDLITTKMSCMPENKEPAFLQALQSITKYEIKDNALLLSDGNQTQLVFVKS
ncbi:MAG TPA: META domain-containing protein [Flavobacterium sp.]|nr:META domain-containing protein [Flavobacterium sp.]